MTNQRKPESQQQWESWEQLEEMRLQTQQRKQRRSQIRHTLNVLMVIVALLGVVSIYESYALEEAIKEAQAQQESATYVLSEAQKAVQVASNDASEAYAKRRSAKNAANQASLEAQNAIIIAGNAQDNAEDAFERAIEAQARADEVFDYEAKEEAQAQAQLAIEAADKAKNEAQTAMDLAVEAIIKAEELVDDAKTLKTTYDLANQTLDKASEELILTAEAQSNATDVANEVAEAKISIRAKVNAILVGNFANEAMTSSTIAMRNSAEAQKKFNNVIDTADPLADSSKEVSEIASQVQNHVDVSSAAVIEVDNAIQAVLDIIAGTQYEEGFEVQDEVVYEEDWQEEAEASVVQYQTLSYTDEDSDSWDVLTPYLGVCYFNGHKETYYSERVLPGGGLDIPGRYTDSYGLVRDGDGYICVAADWSYIPYGSIVETSLGWAKVYDTGCDYGVIDIYTNW